MCGSKNEFASAKRDQNMMKSEKGKSGISYDFIYIMFNTYTTKYDI